MIRNWENELKNRVKWLKDTIEETGTKGIILGHSGGKDCTLVSILAKKAGIEVVNISMPCGNLKLDEDYAEKFCKLYDVEYHVIDLQEVFEKEEKAIKKVCNELGELPLSNIKPRLRMTTIYSIGQQRKLLVAGTGNRSETFMGYFTKFGDGGYDLNPISDLTVREIYEFLDYIQEIDKIDLTFITKRVPSAGLYEGQTDEIEMGVTYKEIDDYLLNGIMGDNIDKILRQNKITEHKRKMPKVYKQQ